MKWGLVLFACSMTVGCTAASKIRDREGDQAVLIQCPASLSFDLCYKRADEECPHGYAMLSERAGFNRKELEVKCKNA